MARRRLTTTALLIAASIGTVVVLATAAGCSAAADAGAAAGGRRGPPARFRGAVGGHRRAGVAAGRRRQARCRFARPGCGADRERLGRSPVLDAVPDPPRLLALPADFASPRSVAAAYLRAWCYAPADQPANTNISNTAPWMTAAGLGRRRRPRRWTNPPGPGPVRRG